MRRFFRSFFRSAPLPALLNYLEDHVNVSAVFSIVARAQPGIQKWEKWLVWKDARTCFVGTIKAGAYPNEMRVSERSFNELESLLNEYGFWKMRDYPGNVRDGTHYTVAFASQQRVRLVRIWNPIAESKPAEFIQRIIHLIGGLDNET